VTKAKTQIVTYPTPLVADILFYEDRDTAYDKNSIPQEYGLPYHDDKRYPDHFLVFVQPNPQLGDKVYRFFYAAERKNQDKYNWEHKKADVGGTRYDTIERKYIYLRSEYTPNAPALGSAMPDVPVGLFNASSYALVSRRQDRISERGRRAQELVGGPELDSLFIVETHTYWDREPIKTSRYDEDTTGVLFTENNIYIRGEDYENQSIEDAVLNASLWGPTSGGKLNSFEQVSDDAWVVTTTDIIPQDKGTTNNNFGGIVLRRYEDSVNYSWPLVLGDDGTSSGSGPVEIMDWELLKGSVRNYIRPRVRRSAYSGPCRALIEEEWITQAQMSSLINNGNLDVIETLAPKPISYPAPLLPVSIPTSLHSAVTLQCDFGTADPTFAENRLSARFFPATQNRLGETQTDWPSSLIADVSAKPFRGGYRVTQVTVYPPLQTT
jgi:hypothetical protein